MINFIFMSDWELGWWFKWIKECFDLLLVWVLEILYYVLIKSDFCLVKCLFRLLYCIMFKGMWIWGLIINYII